jgi:N6-L-threonylcarbamoyladenine synthase
VLDEFIGLVVSGGHTALYGVSGARVTTLAETRDDAFGEAFDKLGKKLGLPYPQGPHVDALAERGVAERCPMPVATALGDGPFFSYSGLKSHALRTLERLGGVPPVAPELWSQPLLDLCAGFRAAAVGQVVDRVARLHRSRPIPALVVSGGAAANRLLRRQLEVWCAVHSVPLHLVPLVYSGDNAAMIAHAALLREQRGERDDPRWIAAVSRLPLG